MNDNYVRQLILMASVEFSVSIGDLNEGQNQMTVFDFPAFTSRRGLTNLAGHHAKAVDGMPFLDWIVVGHVWNLHLC